MRIGLALGGGGARGLAHIVVLEALDDLGLRPVALAGASMGAIVGAAYAAGMSGRDIRAHVLRVLHSRRRVLSLLLEARVGRFADLLTRGLTNPVLVDAEAVLALFWPAAMPESFEDLAIPLAVVATDFHARSAAVLRSGPLASAVAGSMAVPGLVRPVTREGRVLVDGGIVNPLPYEVLARKGDLLLACDVSGGRDEATGPTPRPLEALLGSGQIMQAALTARILEAGAPDLLIRPPVEDFRLLDFFRAARVLEAAEPCRDFVKREVALLLAGL